MYKYKVIWFDDEHESLDSIREKAILNDIELIGFSNAKQGIEELRSNIKNYDAAIVDGLFFLNEDQAGIPTSDKPLFNVGLCLNELKAIKVLPWFILSGQTSFTKGKNPSAENFKDNQVYDKLNNAHLENLWSDIKAESIKQEETQIRLKYYRVFEVCTEKYLDHHVGNDILSLLMLDETSSIENHFNTIRKIVEDLFKAFHRFGLLPTEFVEPIVALNQSSIFLAGQDQHEKTENKYKKYIQLEGTHLPLPIALNLKYILSITQAGSHRSSIDQHVRTLKTPYLLKSVLFQLLDVIIWFKLHVDSNPETDNWVKTETQDVLNFEAKDGLISGVVIQKCSQKGFAFFKPDIKGENIFIPPHLVSEHSLENDIPIKVVSEEYVCDRTGDVKNRVKAIVFMK